MTCDFSILKDRGIQADTLRFSPRDENLILDSQGNGYSLSSTGRLFSVGSSRGKEKRRVQYLQSDTCVDLDAIRQRFALMDIAVRDRSSRDSHIYQLREFQKENTAPTAAQRAALIRLGFPSASREQEQKMGKAALASQLVVRRVRTSKMDETTPGCYGLSSRDLFNLQVDLVRTAGNNPDRLQDGIPLRELPHSFAKWDSNKMTLFSPLIPIARGGWGAVSACTMFTSTGTTQPCIVKEASPSRDEQSLKDKAYAQLENECRSITEVFEKHRGEAFPPPVRGPVLETLRIEGNLRIALPLIGKTLRVAAIDSSHQVRQKLVYGFLNIMRWLFSKPYAHLDIKLENILVDDKGDQFFADLGTWRNLSNRDQLMQSHGSCTPSYCTYEDCRLLNSCKDESLRVQYCRKIDEFASAVVIFILLSNGQTPYSTEDHIIQGEYMGKYCRGFYQAHHLSHINPKGQKLLMQMLELDPNRRMPFAKAMEEMQADPHLFDLYEGPKSVPVAAAAAAAAAVEDAPTAVL